MPVKNLILDLGGVLIDVDYRKTSEAFKRLGLDDIDDLYSQQRQTGLFDDMDKGLVSDDAFRQALKRHLPPAVTDGDVDTAWNAMLGRIPQERVALLEKLRPDYRLFLLSNTNRIHIPAFLEIVHADYGFNVLDTLFERTYFSCMIGMRKPDREIFDFVLAENDLDPADTLFIDDSVQHVEGALAAGLPAVHLDLEKETLRDLLGRVLGEE